MQPTLDTGRERVAVSVLALVQFINVADFMIVSPLGPDFALALDVPMEDLGLLAGAYTVAAAVAGLLGSLWLDRFARRSALIVSLLGLTVGTVLCSLAVGITTLLLARIVAGFFAGLVAGLTLAIVTDIVPYARRGRAMGVVMSAVSFAHVGAVPLAIELSQLEGWRLPFIVIAGLAAIAIVAVRATLPELVAHIDVGPRAAPTRERVQTAISELVRMCRRPSVLASLAGVASINIGGYMLIPYMAAYVQFNLGFSRSELSHLFLIGGVCSLIATRLAGPVVDRVGSLSVALAATLVMVVAVDLMFVHYAAAMPVMVLFCAMFFAAGFRRVSNSTLGSAVPSGEERSRFMSLTTTVHHCSSSIGALAAFAMLTELPGGALQGIVPVAVLSMAVTLFLPLCLLSVQRRLRAERSFA